MSILFVSQVLQDSWIRLNGLSVESAASHTIIRLDVIKDYGLTRLIFGSVAGPEAGLGCAAV